MQGRSSRGHQAARSWRSRPRRLRLRRRRRPSSELQSTVADLRWQVAQGEQQSRRALAALRSQAADDAHAGAPLLCFAYHASPDVRLTRCGF